MQDLIANTLAQVPAFNVLDDAVLAQVAAFCSVLRFPAGALLFRAGAEARGLYFLSSGRVRLYRASRAARIQTLGTEEPFAAIGEIGSLTGRQSTSAEALEDTRVVLLPRADAEEVARSCAQFSQAVSRLIALRASDTIDRFERVALHTVPARVAAYFRDVLREDAFRLLPCSQEELGHELGATRESVARAIAGLKRAGVVQQSERAYRILDSRRLREIAELEPT